MQLQEYQEITENERNDVGKSLISHFSEDRKSDVTSLKFNCRFPDQT